MRGGSGGASGGGSGGRGGEAVETEAVAVKSAESSTRLAMDTVVTLALAQHCQ